MTTPNIGLDLIPDGAEPWGQRMRDNFSLIDQNVVPVAPLTFDSVVFVAKVGDDTNTGTDARNPKLTFASAMTKASELLGTVDRVKVEVLDAGSYTEAGDLTVPADVALVAPQATYTGRVFLETLASFEVYAHYPSESGQRMLNRTFGGADAGTAWYRAHISDGRGAAGDLTHSANIFNQGGAGRNLFIDVELVYVSANGVGISDISGGNAGHIHFYAADIYLAGTSAVGIKAAAAESNIIGYVDHILEIGTAIGTSGIRVVAAGADVRVTAGGIVADTAYYIDGGDLYLSCPKIIGATTGTETPTQRMLGTADRPQQEVLDDARVEDVIAALKAAGIFIDPA